MNRLKTRIIIKTIIVASVLSILSFAFGQTFISLGILVGALTGIFCFQLLSKSVLASASLKSQKLKAHFFLKYLTRYAIMGVVLFLCAQFEFYLFLGAAGGLLLIYIIIFLDAFKQCKIQAK